MYIISTIDKLSKITLFEFNRPDTNRHTSLSYFKLHILLMFLSRGYRKI